MAAKDNSAGPLYALLTQPKSEEPNGPVHRDTPAEPSGSPWPTLGALIAICALTAAYFVFVIHYSVNGLLLDDWSFVHLVHAALHGTLTLGAVWSQHNENRMFVPNAMMVALAIATHDNTKTEMVTSALVFGASYLCFLAVLQAYLQRRLTVVEVMSTGVVWFSLADWQNALWGFQFAWYLILFLLVAMLGLLIAVPVDRRGPLVFAGAVLITVAASYSSAQGVFLWPIGLLCLCWPLTGSPRRWPRRAKGEILVWVVLAATTVGSYFLGYRRTTAAFYGTSLRYPVASLKAILANVGEIVPTTNEDVGVHELLGLFLLLVAAFVVMKSIQARHVSQRSVFPVALILFAVLFDLSVVSLRLTAVFGLAPSLAPRYTMANLLILLAIIVYALGPVRQSGKLTFTRGSGTRLVAMGMLALLVAIQVVASTDNGISRAETTKESMILGDRIVVNRNRIPHSEQQCYAFAGIETYTGEVNNVKALDQAERDHLGEFSSGPYGMYRAEGLPTIAQCRPQKATKAG